MVGGIFTSFILELIASKYAVVSTTIRVSTNTGEYQGTRRKRAGRL